MPEGPFGFPRITSWGPFTKAKDADEKYGWDDCSEAARDEVDEQICQMMKRRAVELLNDPDVKPPVNSIEEVNYGFCITVSMPVYGELMEKGVKPLVDGTDQFQHCWIEYNGRHFDAEVPTGVDDPNKLPVFQRENTHKITEETWKEATEPSQ